MQWQVLTIFIFPPIQKAQDYPRPKKCDVTTENEYFQPITRPAPASRLPM